MPEVGQIYARLGIDASGMVSGAQKGFRIVERQAIESARKMVEEAKRSANEQGRLAEILEQKQVAASRRYEATSKAVEKAREEAAKVASEGASKSAQKAADAVVKAKEREAKSAQDGLSTAIRARREASDAAKRSADEAAKAVEVGALREKRAHEDAGRAARATFAKFASDKAKALGEGAGKLGNALSLGFTAPALGLGAWAVKAAAEVENAQMMLTNVMGSAKLATAEIAKLNETAKLPGLGQLEVYRMSAQFQTLGMSADKARKAVAEFGNLNALGGGDASNVAEIGRQFTQIVSLGKVTAENLNVIIERSAMFKNVLKNAFGTSSGETIQKAMEAGKLSMSQFVDGVIAEMGRLKRGQATSTDDWQNFTDEMRNQAGTLGKAIIPELKKMGPDISRSFGEVVKAGLPLVKELLPEVTKGIEWAAKAFHDLSPGTREMIAKFAILGAVGGPVFKAAGAIYEVGRSIATVISGGVRFGKWVAETIKGWQKVGEAARDAKTIQGSAPGLGGGAAAGSGGVSVVSGLAASGAIKVGGVTAMALAPTTLGDPNALPRKALTDSLVRLYKTDLPAFYKAMGKITGNGVKSGIGSALGTMLDSAQTRAMSAQYFEWRRKQNAAYDAGDSAKFSASGRALQGLPPRKKPSVASTSATDTSPSVVDLSNWMPAKKPHASRTLKSDLPLLTGDVISGMAKGIDTPAGSASCATFASRLVARFTKGVTDQGGKIEAGAKALVNRFLAVGARQVKPGKNQSAAQVARPGDLVYYYGAKYGAMKDAQGKGWHVGVATGNRMMRDSSGGKDNRLRPIGADAQLLRLPKSRLTGFQASGGGIEGLARQLTPEEERQKAYGEGLARMKETLAGLTDGRKRYADALGISLASFKRLSPEEQAATRRLVTLSDAQERAVKLATAHKSAMADLARERAKALNGGKEDPLDTISFERFGKAFSALTDQKNRAAVEEEANARKEIDGLNARTEATNRLTEAGRERTKVANEFVRSTYKENAQALVGARSMTNVEKLSADLKEKGVKVGWLGYAALRSQAEQLDAIAARERDAAVSSQQRETAGRATLSGLAAENRYREAMVDLQARLSGNGIEIETARRRKELAASFAQLSAIKAGGSAMGTALNTAKAAMDGLAVGSERAKRYLEFSAQISGVERLRETFRSAAQGIGDDFRKSLGELVRADFPNFFSSLGGLVNGFINRLGTAVIDAQIDRIIGGAIGKIGVRSKEEAKKTESSKPAGASGFAASDLGGVGMSSIATGERGMRLPGMDPLPSLFSLLGLLGGSGGGGLLGGLLGKLGSFGAFLGPLGGLLGGKIFGRASGGYVEAGHLYRVNEAGHGTELLMPSQSGYVQPKSNARGGGVSVVVNNYISGPVDRRSSEQIATVTGQAALNAVRTYG